MYVSLQVTKNTYVLVYLKPSCDSLNHFCYSQHLDNDFVRMQNASVLKKELFY